MNESLVDLLQARATETPSKIAFSFRADLNAIPDKVTYLELWRIACSLSKDLAPRIKPGTPVAIGLPNSIEFVAAFFAVLISGGIAVPVPEPLSKRAQARCANILKACKGCLMISSAESSRRFRPEIINHDQDIIDSISIESFRTYLDRSSDLTDKPVLVGTNTTGVAVLQFTSGSLAAPKGVILTHGNILANLRQIGEAFRHDEEIRVLTWLPNFHDMGLIGGILHPIYAGCHCDLFPPSLFSQNPLDWLTAISSLGATTSGAPNFAYESCARIAQTGVKLPQLDLSKWKVAFCGAEKVRNSTRTKFCSAFAAVGFDSQSFVPCYGLAEASLLVTSCVPGRSVSTHILAGGQQNAKKTSSSLREALVSSGLPPTGISVFIVDRDTNRVLAENDWGEIVVSGPNIAQGYWENPQASEEVFCDIHLEGQTQRALRTGDLGTIIGGELFVLSRIKDTIIIKGENFFSEDVEELLEELAHLPTGCRIAVCPCEIDSEETFKAVVELPRTSLDTQQELAHRMAERLFADFSVDAVSIWLVPRGAIPRTSSGKLRRASLHEKQADTVFREGSIEHLIRRDSQVQTPQSSSAADPSTLESIINTIVERSSSLSESLAEIHSSSLSLIKLQSAIARHYKVKISIATIVGCTRVEELQQRINELLLKGCSDILPAKSGEESPLSPTQQEVWAHQISNPESRKYLVGAIVDIRGQVSAEEIQSAVDLALVNRPVLLSRIRQQGAAFTFEPAFSAKDIIRIESLPISPGSLRADLYNRLNSQMDPLAGPLCRVWIVTVEAGRHLLFFAAHHVVGDLLSFSELFECLESLLTEGDTRQCGIEIFSPSTLTELETSERSPIPEGAPESFTGKLDFGNQSSSSPSERLVTSRFSLLSDELIQPRARAMGVTTATLMVSAASITISYLSGLDNLIIGIPTHQGSFDASPPVNGLAVGIAPLPVQIDWNDSVTNLVKKTYASLCESLDRRYRSMGSLLKDFNITATSPGRLPLSLLVSALPDSDQFPLSAYFGDQHFDNLQCGGAESATKRPEVEVLLLQKEQSFADLSITVATRDRQNEFLIEAYDDFFSEVQFAAFCDTYSLVLHSLLGEATSTISELMQKSRPSRLSRMKGAEIDELPESIAAAFEASALKHSDTIAIEDANLSLSYREFAQRVELFERALRQLDVEIGHRVAISCERSVNMVATMVAILKIGAAYIPIELDLPSSRLKTILEDGDPGLLLTDGHKFGPEVSCPAYSLAELISIAERCEPQRRSPLTDWHSQTAYILFTSGSAGTPKGVAVCQRGVLALASATRLVLKATPRDRILAATPLSWDLSVFELIISLLNGYTVVLSGGALDIVASQTCPDFDILNTAPSVGQLLFNSGLLPKTLRKVIFAGEPLLKSLSDQFYSLPTVTDVFNLYGPTETTIYCSWHRVDRHETRNPPIGVPMPGTWLQVVNKNNDVLPPGFKGELIIGGDLVGAGYVRRAELTNARFVNYSDFSDFSVRAFRSGDVCEVNEQRQFVFGGRIDHQIKLNGVRIELLDIECAVCAATAAETAIVSPIDIEGRTELVALIEGVSHPLPEEIIIEEMLKLLPQRMVPHRFFFEASMPRFKNGKIDRKRCHALINEKIIETGRASANREMLQDEELVTQSIRRILGIPHAISQDDDFFSLGGDSISAVRISSDLSRSGIQLKPSDILSGRTTREALRRASMAAKSLTIGERVLQSYTIFSSLKLRNPNKWAQGLSFEVDFSGSDQQLRELLISVAASHSVFQRTFTVREDGLLYTDQSKILLQIVSADGLKGDDEHVLSQLGDLISLEEGPTSVAAIHTSSETPCRFTVFWVAHHLLVDFVSWSLLLDAFDHSIEQLTRHGRINPTPPTLQRTQKTISVQSFPIERIAWKPLNDLKIAPASIERSFKSVDIPLANWMERSEKLSVNSPQLLQSILIASIIQSHNKLFKSETICITCESHGRNQNTSTDALNEIGWLTTMFNLFVSPSENSTNGHLLEEIALQLRKQSISVTNSGKTLKMSDIGFNYLGLLPNSATRFQNIHEVKPSLRLISGRENQGVFPIEWTAVSSQSVLKVELSFTHSVLTDFEADALSGYFCEGCRELLQLPINTLPAYITEKFPLANLRHEELADIENLYQSQMTTQSD